MGRGQHETLENNMKLFKGIVIISIGLMAGVGSGTKSYAQEDFCAVLEDACRAANGTPGVCNEFLVNIDECSDPLTPDVYDNACKNIGTPGTCDVTKAEILHTCECP